MGCLKYEYYNYLHDGASKYTLFQIGTPALPDLIKALGNQDYIIAEGAAIVLGMIGQEAKEAGPALKELLLSKSTPQGLNKYNVVKALGKIGEIDFLIRLINGEEAGAGWLGAIDGIIAAGPKAVKAIPMLLEMINSDIPVVQALAADALGAIGEASHEAIPRLKILTRSWHRIARNAAGEALLKIGTPEAIEAAKSYKSRKDIIDGFFDAMFVFFWKPWLAVVVGLLIGVTGYLTTTKFSKKNRMMKSLYLPLALWLIYAVLEFILRYSSGGPPIRVDLIIIYPLLFVVTIAGFVFWFIGVVRGRKAQREGSE